MPTGIRLTLVALVLSLSAIPLPAAASAEPEGPERVDVDVDRKAGCPQSTVAVTLSAEEGGGEPRFTIYRNGDRITDGVVSPGKTRTERIYVRPGRSARIKVTISGQGTSTFTTKSTCRGMKIHRGGHLPRTGPATDLMAKLATAGGLLLTGGIIWWYGSVWPRRTPAAPITVTRSPTARRRYPDLDL